MVVTVQLHTILQRQTPQGLVNRLDLALPAGSTVGDVLKSLEIVMEPEALLLVVNRRWAELETVLQDQDELHLIPAISGG
ncbi:MAG: MoaD/ThiS family protein [Anaerolineales bacterium]|nr:MoaD/ThiS family protein [Anaerolineales bacterium]